MPHSRFLALVEPFPRTWPLGIAQRPETSAPIPGESDHLRFQSNHFLGGGQSSPLEGAADQRPMLHLLGHALYRHRPKPTLQGFGDELAFRQDRVTHEAVLNGVIDRQSLTSRLSCYRTLTTVYRRQDILLL